MQLNSIQGLVNTKFDLKELQESSENEILEARKTLNRIRKEKTEKTIEEEYDAIKKKFSKDSNLYEEYDPATFENKLRVDSLFYEHILSKLPDSVYGLEEAIASYYRTVRNLYEMINIKPASYRALSSNILMESISDQGKKFEQVVMEHLNNYYYKLPLEKRKTKYLEAAKPFAKDLMENSGAELDEAIALSVKAVILESLVSNIAIPRSIQSRIKYLCEDADYGKVFDQDKLKYLWESFKDKSKNLAKIVAISI